MGERNGIYNIVELPRGLVGGRWRGDTTVMVKFGTVSQGQDLRYGLPQGKTERKSEREGTPNS